MSKFIEVEMYERGKGLLCIDDIAFVSPVKDVSGTNFTVFTVTLKQGANLKLYGFQSQHNKVVEAIKEYNEVIFID